MASMKLEKQLEEQPPEKKPRIANCQDEGGNASNLNEQDLPKSMEGDKESTNLPSSHRHRKLPAELNREIFYWLKLATRRKFIWGLGWDFYAMFLQILLKKSKRLRNPERNAWRSNGDVTISEDGLVASKNTNEWQHIYAEKGFPISVEECRKDDFPGTICYYYEITISKSTRTHWCFIGLSDGEILPGGLIGRSPNFYGIDIPPIPNHNFYHLCLAGQHHLIEFPEGVIRPELKATGNVVGCGILMNPDDKLTIFFTLNGILIGRQFPIDPTVDHLIPTVVWDDMSVEANFGDNPAKPFEYDIKKCPGMGLEWI